MSVTKISVGDWEEKVLNAKNPVFVKWYADTCMPCKMMAPKYKELSEKLSPQYDKMSKEKVGIDFYEIDGFAEENANLAKEWEVMNLPYVMFFNNGEYLDSQAKNIKQEHLYNMLEYHLDEDVPQHKGLFKRMSEALKK